MPLGNRVRNCAADTLLAFYDWLEDSQEEWLSDNVERLMDLRTISELRLM